MSSLVAFWGIGGVLILFGQAVYRLTPYAVEPIFTRSLSVGQALVYVAWIAFSLYFEGYRAFQKRFSPRVVARALHLAEHPKPLHVLFAPAYCMGLFHASRKLLALAWGTLAMVLFFITVLRYVAQPWRGIVDGGVVLALAWGGITIVIYFARALRGHRPPADPELPLARSELYARRPLL